MQNPAIGKEVVDDLSHHRKLVVERVMVAFKVEGHKESVLKPSIVGTLNINKCAPLLLCKIYFIKAKECVNLSEKIVVQLKASAKGEDNNLNFGL